jgi:hypothetical protein
MAQTLEPARLTLDLLSWPIDHATTYGSPDTRFLSALTGGFLLGWGVMIWCLSTWVYDLAPEPVRKSVLIPTCIDHDPRTHLRRPMVMMCHG